MAGLPAKQMELAREIVPGASSIGLLTNMKDPKAPPQMQELEATARALEVKRLSADANQLLAPTRRAKPPSWIDDVGSVG